MNGLFDQEDELAQLSKLFSEKFSGQVPQQQGQQIMPSPTLPNFLGSDEDLEALRKRYQQRALANDLVASKNPNADLGLQLAGGIADLFSKSSNAMLDPVETLTGIKLRRSEPLGAQESVKRAIASRNTAARQQALDDFSMLKSLQAIKDNRDRMAQTYGQFAEGKQFEKEKQKDSQDWQSIEKAKDRAASLESARISAGAKKKQDDEIHGRELRQQALSLSKGASTNADMANTFKEVDNALGFPLDSYDPKTGKVNGKKLDLPGKNIPLIGRTSFYSKDARNLDNTVARLFNIQLKDRSGSAVTSPEMQRLKSEWSSGIWNTEEEMISGIQRAKRALIDHQRQIESGYDPKAKELYKKEGGILIDDIYSPKQVNQKPELTRERAIEIAKKRGLIK